jgi:hypothetical protein
MAIDFSSLDAVPAKTGKIDFSAIGGIPAVGQDEPTDETSILGAAGRGATSMIPLGNQAYSAIAGAAENKPYLQERQELEKEVEADKANHPIARLAGEAAGIAAPALLTGGASAPESLLGAVGQGAGIGAGFGAGNAIDTIASGGSAEKAAGDVALGAGLGAAGGATGSALAGLANKAVPAVENFAARKALQSANLGPEELANMTPEQILATGKMLLDKQIVKPGASTQEMFDAAKQLREDYGTSIGQIGGQARELGLSTDTKPLLAALEDKYQAASALSNPDEVRNALFYKKGMADILAMSRQNLPENLAGVQGAPVPSDITFDQLQRLKKSYGNSAFMNGTVKNPAAADVYSQLSRGQQAIVKTAQNNPDLPAQLKDAMAGYSTMHPIVEGLQDVLGKERAGTLQPRAFGIVGKLAASLPGQSNPIINALTALGLVAAGHPLWGVGAFTATLNNPKVMASAAQSMAGAVPGVAAALPGIGAQAAGSAAPTSININHPEMAPWKPVFQKNAMNAKNDGEVQKSNAVTDFVLSQRDPSYAAAKQKMAENPSPEPVKMADGGTVEGQSNDFSKPTPGFGSTLVGLENQLKNPTHETPPAQPEALPAYSTTKMHEPFNSDFADKLKAFMESQKEKDDGGRS